MGRPPFDSFCTICGKRIRRGGTRCLACYRARKSVPTKDRMMDAFIDYLVATKPDHPITRLLSEDECLNRYVKYNTMTAHILKHGVDGNGLVIRSLANLWTEYINSIGKLQTRRQPKYCEICGKERSATSQRWCRPCSNKVRSEAMKEHHKEAALKRGQRRRDDILLANMMREEIVKRGLDLESVLRALRRKE